MWILLGGKLASYMKHPGKYYDFRMYIDGKITDVISELVKLWRKMSKHVTLENVVIIEIALLTKDILWHVEKMLSSGHESGSWKGSIWLQLHIVSGWLRFLYASYKSIGVYSRVTYLLVLCGLILFGTFSKRSFIAY